LYATDRGTYVVQGKLVTDNEAIACLVDVRDDEFYVEIPKDDAWFMDWYDAVRQFAAAGKRMQRVRVVSEPHSDYTRFGIDLARRLNVPAGEDIRYLARHQAEDLGLPNEDFWLLDSTRLLTLHFDGDVLLGPELVTDQAAVAQRAQWRDVAWCSAIPLHEYAVA
jgi:hypothetical protein